MAVRALAESDVSEYRNTHGDTGEREDEIMSVRRLSISVPAEVEQRIRRAAEHAGMSVSAWIAKVAEHQAIIEEGMRGVAEHEAEYGPLPEAGLADAEAALIALGVIRDPKKAR